MKVSFIFPKESVYNKERVNDYLNMRDKFKFWITLIQECGYTIECLQENALARIVMNEFQVKDVNWVTTIQETDFQFAMQHKDLDTYPTYVFDEYKSYSVYPSSSQRRYTYSIKDMKGTSEERLKTRYNILLKRYKFGIREYIDKARVVVFFSASRGFAKPKADFEVGDGILFINVNLESNYTDIRYSGVSLDDVEFVKTILMAGGI